MDTPDNVPAAESLAATQTGKNLRTLAIGLTVCTLVLLALTTVVNPAMIGRAATIALATGSIAAVSLLAARRCSPRAGALVFIAGNFLFVAWLTWTAGGVRAPAALDFVPLVLFAGILLGFRGGLFAATGATFWLGWLVLAAQRELLPPPLVKHTDGSIGLTLVTLVACIGLAHWTLTRERQQLEQTRTDLAAKHRQAESRLAENEKRLASALEAARDGLFDIDFVSGTVHCNDRYFTMLGYTPGELTPSVETWSALLHPDDRAMAEATLASYHRVGHEDHRIETRLRAKDGSWRWILSRGQITSRLPDGRPRRLIGTHVDISEQKQAERALAKERDLVARLVETSPSGIIVVDLAGQVVFANTEAERILDLHLAPGGKHYPPADWKLHTPEGIPVQEKDRAFRRVLDTGAPIHDARYLLEWRSGRRILLSINAAPLLDPSGHCEGVVATLADISEQQKAEAALRQSEQRLRDIVDHAPFGSHLYELQPDGGLVLTAANQSADILLGIRHEPLLGREITDAFPGLAGSDLPETYRNVALSGQPYHRNQFHYEADRIAGVFDVHAIPLGANRVIVFFADITERERAEAALRHSEEQYRLLFNAGNDAIFVHGFGPDQRPGNFTQVNDIACQLLAYSRDELLRRSPAEICAQTTQPALAEVAARLLCERHALFEIELVAGDGRHIPAEINTRVFELEGRATALSVVRDLSQRRRLQDQLRQAQKMEVFGQLAGGVAHDFNNLLVAIIGNSELLLESAGLAGRPREQLVQVHEAGKRAAALTRQLLLFSRKQQAQPTPGDLNEIIGHHLKLLRRIIGEDIDLAVEFAAGPLPIVADANMIEQVAMNLVVNARDAMPGGGALVVRTLLTELDDRTAPANACPPGTYASLVVADTGTGIPESVRPHIFEPFFTTKPSGHGTGLGLATVLGIVQQHRGGILVRSTEGKGTEFTVHLPLQRSATAAPPTETPAPAPPTRPSASLLVVEDDVSVAGVVAHTLRKAGYSVRIIGSAAEAMLFLANDTVPLDLVVSDVVMPGGISGVEFAARLAVLRPGLRVALMSGYSKELEHGGTKVLQKPFTTTQLLDFVHAALDQPAG